MIRLIVSLLYFLLGIVSIPKIKRPDGTWGQMGGQRIKRADGTWKDVYWAKVKSRDGTWSDVYLGGGS